MNRREFITGAGLLGGGSILAWQLSSGASSASASEQATGISVLTTTPVSTPVSSRTSTAAATETETETETTETEAPEEPTATETETDTLSGEESRGARQLSSTEQSLTGIVETFTDDDGTELTDVTAMSTDFDNRKRDLQVEFAEAQKEYTTALDYAANASQESTAELMKGCWQFLRQTMQVQLEVVYAYQNLEQIRDAFKQNNADRSESQITQFSTNQRQADSKYQTLSSESTAESVSVIEAISAEEYEGKLAQFDADITLYQDLGDPLATFSEGVRLLKQANGWMYNEPRNYGKAEQRAEDAKDSLGEAWDEIKDLAEDATSDATIVPMLNSLRSVASDKIDEADKILDEY